MLQLADQLLHGPLNAEHRKELKKLTSFLIESYLIAQKHFLKHLGIEPASILQPFEDKIKNALMEMLENDPSSSQPLDHPLLAEIDNLLKHHRGLLTHSLKDARHHIERLLRSEQLSRQQILPHLQAWHTRNLMNIQWVLELLLGAIYTSQFPQEEIHIHNFDLLLAYLFKNSEKHPDIRDCNYSLAVHYPFRYQKGRLLAASIESGLQLMGAPKTHKSSKQKQKEAEKYRETVTRNSAKGLEAAITLLTEIGQNLATAKK